MYGRYEAEDILQCKKHVTMTRYLEDDTPSSAQVLNLCRRRQFEAFSVQAVVRTTEEQKLVTLTLVLGLYSAEIPEQKQMLKVQH